MQATKGSSKTEVSSSGLARMNKELAVEVYLMVFESPNQYVTVDI